MNRARYSSIHNPDIDQRKRLDEYDFANDIPIARRFKELDKQYENSKFIYTIRDIESWIESVDWHWKNFDFTNYKWAIQDRYEMFGVYDFNKDKLIESYKKHDEDVLDYFKDRPEELLILNIINGEGWDKLLPFIRKQIRDQNFPYVNKRNSNE